LSQATPWLVGQFRFAEVMEYGGLEGMAAAGRTAIITVEMMKPFSPYLVPENSCPARDRAPIARAGRHRGKRERDTWRGIEFARQVMEPEIVPSPPGTVKNSTGDKR
jgi:hypothetical protein